MSQYTFPAIFLWDDNENYYDVTFPDMENCFTAGENLPEALSNAADALALILCDKEDQGQKIPAPTPLGDIKEPRNGFVNLVLADTDTYRAIIERENNPIKYARKKVG